MSLQEAAIAAGRFGFGARPGELALIAGDPRGWVKAQLTPQRSPPPAIAALPATEDDLWAYGRWLAQVRADAQQRAAAMASGPDAPAGDMPEMSLEDAFRRGFRERIGRAIRARIDAGVSSDRPVHERLVHFWSNHFTVSAGKPASVAMPASFERDVVRPRAVGAFVDLLQASTRHPGMLLYLDNWQSVGPNSTFARASAGRAYGPAGRRAPRGINENLAREILELHTLGVDGGYSQTDVRALAEILTGWTYQRPSPAVFLSDQPGVRSGDELFLFEARTHEPGPKTLLGRTYATPGLIQGEAALADLARHRATARFIALKLARHYIADAPPPAAVQRIARAFQDSDGDIAVTMGALVDCPEVWAAPFAKYKRPEEYAVSVARALGLQGLNSAAAAQAILAMGQRIYAPPGPDGWADEESAWLSADLIWKRIEFAQGVAQRMARADVSPLDLGEAVLGPLMSGPTRQAVARADSPAQGLTLLFASPEFQRR